jgi:hypothetical protein
MKELEYMVEVQEWGYLAELGPPQACQEDKSWTDNEKVPRILPSLPSNGTQLEFADLEEAIQYVE